MSRLIRAAALVGALATVSPGCASRGSVRQAADDVQALQAEVSGLRRSQDELSRRVTELTSAVQAGRADTEQLRSTLAAATADVERLGAKVRGAEEAIDDVRETLATRAASPPPPPPVPAPAPAAAPPADPPKPERGGSAESAFSAGLTNFRNREYGQAVIDFLEVVTKYASHELAPTAQFWIGESYYLQHDYRQALVEFQRAADWTPPHAKAPDALVKAGLCYGQLRESARAQQTWRRVVREFPGSPAAEEARRLLAGKGGASPSGRQP